MKFSEVTWSYGKLHEVIQSYNELHEVSERPKRQKSVSAETEISAKLTESSAEISAENMREISGILVPKNCFLKGPLYGN